MSKRTFQALAMVLAVSVVALGSFAAGTAARAVSDPAGDAGENGESFLQHLHSVAYRLHGGGLHGHHGAGHGQGHGDFWDRMGRLVESLDLSPDQTRRLEAIHQALGSMGTPSGASMTELHERLIEQFEDGGIQAGALRPMIDQHLAEIRAAAYSVTDELVALVNSLDARQRDIVLEHLQAARHHHGR